MKSTCFAQHQGHVITQTGRLSGGGGGISLEEIHRLKMMLPQTCFVVIVAVIVIIPVFHR